MTTLLSASPSRAASKHSYKETPGVKKLQKGYSLFPKSSLSGTSQHIITATGAATVGLVVMVMAMAVATMAGISAWLVLAVMCPLVLAQVLLLLRPVISWLFTSPNSPVVINKVRRNNIEKTRIIATQLGESVVPVLTEAHITAIQNVHNDLIIAARISGKARHDNPNDYDRIAVLLLKELNREQPLLDLINVRGLATMDEIEETLRDIESNTSGPVQSGWL